MKHEFHLISGYWLSDGTRFHDRVVTSASMEDFDDEEDFIFFFDIDRDGLDELVSLGEGTGEEFVVTEYLPLHIVTDASESPHLKEGEVEVWYMKNWIEQYGSTERPDPENLSKTHVLVGRIEAEHAEEVFLKMQGENWSPRGEAFHFIKRIGVQHTSMSVGDVVVINGKAMMVNHCGFIELDKVKEPTLMDKVIEQVKEDISLNDFTALQEMLAFLPKDILEAYIPENTFPPSHPLNTLRTRP